ncbi:neuroendocrine convertase 1-like isoform X2 [Daphnia pulicaria]|nr:neuroendocrine convertase 1-like isoform X2 [Daphnia pulicaria]
MKERTLDLISMEKLSTDPRIVWAEKQIYQRRDLRFISSAQGRLLVDEEDLSNLTDDNEIESDGSEMFNDPQYPLQWYLHGKNPGDTHHLNVTPVWRKGLTGRGVAIAVLDDNVNPSNPEIRRNYDPNISVDLGAKSGPGIKKNPIHGTYCASIIAAEANNNFCGVGVAFNARVGGVRLLAKKRVLDVQEARALNYKLNEVDIYSASWGPPDDGKHIGGPGKLSYHALERGVELGRRGRGAIYIWASGNGGIKGDNCAYDSYASSVYTLSVSALTPQGLSPYYAEPCPAVLTSLYVGGQHLRPKSPFDAEKTDNVVVPEGSNGCQNQFQGTSAAAPLAAGIIALLLEANPLLTWRDVQHLVVLSSSPPKQDYGNKEQSLTHWPANGAGLRSNVLYGFGALNAGRLIDLGLGWKSVPAQIRTSTQCPAGPIILPPNRPVHLTLDVTSNVSISSLEYVTMHIDVDVKPRGALTISLQSPSGMVSQLLAPRPHDLSNLGLRNWNLTSAQFWGENPTGQWRLYLTNLSPNSPGMLHLCSLILLGF